MENTGNNLGIMGVELGIIIFIQCALAHRATACYILLQLLYFSILHPLHQSLLSNCFSKRQDSSLSAYVEASLMLQYNKR